MSESVLPRKRIWEVDCLTMDAVIAASFDWRELVNLLRGSGQCFNLNQPEQSLELKVQCLAHQFCHSENPVSLKIENFLNVWHRRMIEGLSDMTAPEVMEYLISFSSYKKLGSVFWALGTDPREKFDCIRRRFHQRMQVVSMRMMTAGQNIKTGAA